jgi:CBS domain-containing protein
MTQYNGPHYPYALHQDEPISQALEALRSNKGLPVVLLNSDNSLFGVISAGDIALYLSLNPNRKVAEVLCSEAANQSPTVGHVKDPFEVIEGFLFIGEIR